jgi:hypothetical protein
MFNQSNVADDLQALWNSREKLFRAWILVPTGILVMLVACFGVDTFFKHFAVSFPASVACMLLLFAGLWICDAVLGSHRTRAVVAAIDVPVSWFLDTNRETEFDTDWKIRQAGRCGGSVSSSCLHSWCYL